MPYIKTLIQKFDSDKGQPIQRAIAVLDMIEYSINYPSCTTITNEELREIEQRAKQLLPELKDNPILAGRIEKWWNDCDKIQGIAKHVYTHRHEHIDSLHYHGDILSIRKTKAELQKLMNGEKTTLDDHGLFGTKHHQPYLVINHYR